MNGCSNIRRMAKGVIMVTLNELDMECNVPFIRFKTVRSAECHFCISRQCRCRRRRHDRGRNRRRSSRRQRLRYGSIQSLLAGGWGWDCGWTVGRVSGAEGAGSPPWRHFLFADDHLAHYWVRWRRWCRFRVPYSGIRWRRWWTRRRAARGLQTNQSNSVFISEQQPLNWNVFTSISNKKKILRRIYFASGKRE